MTTKFISRGLELSASATIKMGALGLDLGKNLHDHALFIIKKRPTLGDPANERSKRLRLKGVFPQKIEETTSISRGYFC